MRLNSISGEVTPTRQPTRGDRCFPLFPASLPTPTGNCNFATGRWSDGWMDGWMDASSPLYSAKNCSANYEWDAAASSSSSINLIVVSALLFPRLRVPGDRCLHWRHIFHLWSDGHLVSLSRPADLPASSRLLRPIFRCWQSWHGGEGAIAVIESTR